MKPFRVSLFRFAAVMAIVVMLMGCTHIIKTSEIPLLQTGSPFKGIKPKTFAFKEFKDVRETTDPLLVTKIGVHEYKMDQPFAIIVATAIKRELERNGHTCIDYSPQSKADFIIEGTVYRYWLRTDTGFKVMTVTGNVAVKLTVNRVFADTGSLSKSYEGEYHISSAWGISNNTQTEILNQALLAMIKEISTDPELIAFIEK